MILTEVRIQNYRSIRDTGWFNIEDAKTILVGPNEAGKTAVLEAIQRVNAPAGIKGFDALRDYPRKLYNADIQSGRRNPKSIPVVSAKFALDADDVAQLPAGFEDAVYTRTVNLDNSTTHRTENTPVAAKYTDELRKSLLKMAAHLDRQTASERAADDVAPSAALEAIIKTWKIDSTLIADDRATDLRTWLDSASVNVDETNTTENNRHTSLLGVTRIQDQRNAAVTTLAARMPVFVYFNNYFRVRPNLHLDHFATRLEQKLLDDDRYDFGNQCLLKLLGFTARELATLGNATAGNDDADSFEAYRKQLDERKVKLNAASVRLTEEIRSVWNPNPDRIEADTLRVQADGQYLTVVVRGTQ